MSNVQQEPIKRKYLTVKRLLFISSSLFLILITIMAVHIYQVTTPRSDGFVNSTLQLARIDFSGELSGKERQSIESYVKSLPGIKNTFMNARANVLVYTYLLESVHILKNKKSNDEPVSEAIVRKVNESGIYNNTIHAERYMVKHTTTGSCPINGKQLSLYRKIGIVMHNILD